jgi:hypothetical protein
VGVARKSEVIFYISNLNNRRLFPYAPVLYFGSSRCRVSHTDSPENRGPKRGPQKPTTNFLQHSWLQPGPCTPSPRPPAIPSPVDGLYYSTVYLENQSVCRFVRIGYHCPLSRKRMCPPPWNQRGRIHSLGGEPIRTTGEKTWHSVYSVPIAPCPPCI